MALTQLTQRTVTALRRKPDLVASAAIFGLSVLVYGLFTLSCSDSWNDLSRMAAIQSVVERSDWRIAPSDFTPLTSDKVFINGHYYSDKTPTLNLIGAGVYSVLRNGFGVRLAVCSEGNVPGGYYWLTLLIVGVSGALLTVMFMHLLRRQQTGLGVSLALTVVLAFATEVFPYSVVFNHHVPSAAAIIGSWYLLHSTDGVNGRRTRALLCGAGLLAGLAATFDLLTGVFAAGLFVLALIRNRRSVIFFVLGALLPVLVMLALDYQMIGTVLPPYMYPNGYKFPGSRFPNTVAGNVPPLDPGQYGFDMLIGVRGLLAFCPLLLLGLAGLVNVMRDRRHVLWLDSWMVAICSAALLAYLISSTSLFGGLAYGERWLLVLVPPILLFMRYVPPFAQTRNLIWRGIGIAALTIALVWSAGSALQGAWQPWRRTPPPLYATLDRAAWFPLGFEFTWR